MHQHVHTPSSFSYVKSLSHVKLSMLSYSLKQTCAHNLQLAFASSLDLYGSFFTSGYSLCRALAQEDVTSGPGAVAEAAGQAGQQMYSQGDAADSLYAYLTRKAGMYPDIVEQLVANHLDKGDNMSALITSEWYMRPKHFSGWGRPYEFTAGLYKQLGRLEESRDSVSIY